MSGIAELQWQGDRLVGQLASAVDTSSPVELGLDGSRFGLTRVDEQGRFHFDLPFSPTGQPVLAITLRCAGTELLPQAWRVIHGQPARYPDGPGAGKSLALRPLSPPWPQAGFLPAALAFAPPVTVIVAVFNAAADVERCLSSMFRHTSGAARLIVIDDASTEPAVAEVLAKLTGRVGVELLRNARNVGYTGTVSAALAATRRDDVVLLNSDTEVGPCWLQGLRNAAYSDASIGSATAVSDNAGAFSVPELEQANELPAGHDFDAVARALWQQAGLSRPALPTGNGFCMYVRRSMLDAVGGPDAEAFPQGYGEENDWCMRAAQQGLRHVIAGNVFVRHARSKSFGTARRLALGLAGMAVLRQRYPHYEAEVGATLLRYERRVLDYRVRHVFAGLAAGRLAAARPRVLYVVDSVSELDAGLAVLAEQVEPMALAWSEGRLILSRYDGTHWQVDEQQLLAACVAFAPSGWDAYERLIAFWIEAYAIEFLHLLTLNGHSSNLAALARALGVRVVAETVEPLAADAPDWAAASLKLYEQAARAALSFSEESKIDGDREPH